MAARLVGERARRPEPAALLARRSMRDALYEDLPATRRLRLHREIGEALERLHARNLEPHLAELAHHFLAAGARRGREGDPLRRAARATGRPPSSRSRRQPATTDRPRLLEARGPDAEQTCDLLLALGDVLQPRRQGIGGEGGAPPCCRSSPSAHGWAERLARAALGYGGRFAWARASTDPALVPLLERALAAVGDGTAHARVRLLARLGGRDARRPLPRAPGRDRPRRRWRSRRRIGDPVDARLRARGLLGRGRGPGHTPSERWLSDELIALAEQLGDKERVFAGPTSPPERPVVAGGPRRASTSRSTLLGSLADELRQPAQHWSVGTDRTMLALMEGRFERRRAADRTSTLALGERAESWNAVVSQRLAPVRAAPRAGPARRARGDHQPLRARIPAAAAVPLRAGAPLRGARPRARRPRRARRPAVARPGPGAPRRRVAVQHQSCSRTRARSSGTRAPRRRCTRCCFPYEQRYAQAPVEVSFGSVARGLGVLATTLRRFDDAERHFAAALEIERRMRARPWLAHTQHDLATMLLARGDRERAREHAAEAVRIYRELGMETWAGRAEALA